MLLITIDPVVCRDDVIRSRDDVIRTEEESSKVEPVQEEEEVSITINRGGKKLGMNLEGGSGDPQIPHTQVRSITCRLYLGN